MEKKEKTNTGKYHVTRHPDGGWQVILGGGSKVIRRTKTQEEAFKIAKEFAENNAQYHRNNAAHNTSHHHWQKVFLQRL